MTEPEVEELLARGGWELDDVQARRRENPDTFWLPSEEELTALKVGDQARLIFRLVDHALRGRDAVEPYDDDGQPNLVTFHERMWLHIVERDADDFVGVLYSVPWSSHTALMPGSRVAFRARDVIDFAETTAAEMEAELEAMADIGLPALPLEASREPVDAARLPAVSDAAQAVLDRVGAKPERPLPMERAITGKALADGWPIFGSRDLPRGDWDSGWAIWSGEGDFEKVHEADGLEVVELTETVARRPAVKPYLALPAGWVFVLHEDGSDDVYRDED